MQLLKRQQQLVTETSGALCVVEEFLGSGGQGEVYRGSLAGTDVAIKWYYPYYLKQDPGLRGRLELTVKKGSPNANFLWPMELVSTAEAEGFGYIMPLRDGEYKSIVDLMKRRADPTFRALTTAGLHLADSFLQLHAKGLCYRDISFGNVFFHPDTGEVLICDNDNVTVDDGGETGVLGTPRFMAPEVVRGDAMPSTHTDLYSLAVLLFYMLMVHHPLEGRREVEIHCLDLPAMNKLYGTQPLFIWDPQDASNRPVPGEQDNAIAYWAVYPQYLRELFTQAFTAGLRDPVNGRVRESEWRSALVRLRDSIIYCGCGAENFYDADALRLSGGAPGNCWACKRQLVLPPRIRVGRSVIMLNHDSRLYPHHIDDQRAYDFSQPIAELSRHPQNPALWGLKNLGQEKWVAAFPDGGVRDIDPGRSVPLNVGLRINFGKVEGEIRV